MNRRIQEALSELERDGRLTAEDVVAAARSPSSPLHPHFTWDDKEAAQQHRLDQARTLIRSVKVAIVVEERVIRSVAYLRDPSAEAKEQGYVKVTQIKTGSDIARDAVVAELARVASALERARAVADVLGLSGEVEDLLASATALRARIFENA